MILVTFSWFIRWMFGFEFSCEYSLCAKGILIKYLSLLLLVSAFLIKLNRLLPRWSLSICQLYHVCESKHNSTAFPYPFLPLKSHPNFKVMLLIILHPPESCSSDGSDSCLLSILRSFYVSNMNYVTCCLL